MGEAKVLCRNIVEDKILFGCAPEEIVFTSLILLIPNDQPFKFKQSQFFSKSALQCL